MTIQGPSGNRTEIITGRPVHGGIKPSQLRALGLRPEDVLDFSASVSPIGTPDGVWDAMRQVDLGAYPDPASLELREALSAHLPSIQNKPVPIERIMVGNGSTEIIHLLARTYLTRPSSDVQPSVLQLTPTYGEYTGACRQAGATVSNLEATPGLIFHWDIAEAVRRILQERPRLVFVCNPNNPTGVYLSREDIQPMAEAAAACGALLVVDEAYLSFVAEPWDAMSLPSIDNVVLLRSMTKDYALTGLRLGYAIASEEVIANLEAFQPDWSVNGLAQAAGLAALADTAYLPRAREAVELAKEYLADRLDRLSLTVHPSAANFMLVNVINATTWHDNLMRLGLFVRDCSSFGLPEFIRIGIRSMADCQRLLEGMETVSFQTTIMQSPGSD
jgi:histidinol-phosphate aminotransferase